MTLEGVIFKPDGTPYTGTFQIRMSSPPGGGESNSVIGLPITVSCVVGATPSGEYSTTLLAGIYSVDIPGTPRFEIQAPTGTGTYALEDIADATVFANAGAIYDSYTEIDDTTVRSIVQVLWVREDFNGQNARFWRIAGTATGLLGVDYVQDAAGTYFERET
jgi:hypothetical protein